MAVVAWLVVLGGTVAIGLAGRVPDPQTLAEASSVPDATALPSVVPLAPRTPTPSRPPIGEDGVMGGLPFGTAFLWLTDE